METSAESRGLRRLRNLARFILIWALVIVGRLIYLQVYQHEPYRQIADDQSHNEVEIPAPRGRLLDREGRTLALSVPADTIVVNPRIAPDLSVAKDLFVPILNLEADRLQARIDWAVANNRGYLPIKQKVSPDESRKIRSLKLDWVEFHRDSRRRYPKGRLAANLIGTVSYRGTGNSGLELSLNDELAGKSGVARILRDARGRAIQTEVLVEPFPGSDVGLTIDERIQFLADRALASAAEEWECKTGSLVVMDPATGEILAMSSYPSFDPNARARSAADLKARSNLAVSTPFEPGSVFKIITISAALETTSLTPASLMDCGRGVLAMPGRRIHDIKAYGTIPLEMVLWKSSNIGAIKAALQIGDRRLLEYVRRFGFGRRTGIHLPAESPGRLRDLKDWGRTSIASIAMGHELSATSLQLALATSVIANGGLLQKPQLVRWTQKPGAKKQDKELEAGTRAIRPETAHTMRMMMEGVVLTGTGRRARLNGYSAASKTGSAQIFDWETKRYSHTYTSSFVGFAPVTDPKVVVAVTLNGARRYGGMVAAPAFQTVAQATLRIMGVVPDIVDAEPFVEPAEEDLEDLAIAGLSAPPTRETSPHGFGYVRSLEGAEVVMAAQSASPYIFGPTVPNFYGQTLRSVIEETSRRGMPLEYEGVGIVRTQYPAPGAVLPVGEKVLVEFTQ